MIGDKWEGCVNIPEGKSADYALEHFTKKGPIPAWNARTMLFGQPKQTVHFDGETKWHRLTYDGGVWMTDLPIEQVQHDRELVPTKNADAVLVGGLGLGYALTKMVRDYDVHEIDVVEISEHVINLVWPHVPPDVKERCRLHHADLFKFLEHPPTTRRFNNGNPIDVPDEWDVAFYDIWQSDGEGTFHSMVMPLREASYRIADCVICWNEDVMRGQLFNALRSRKLMLDNPQICPPQNDPEELKKFLRGNDDPYHRWACPFWRGVLDGHVSDEEFNGAAASYVREYGLHPDWKAVWEEEISEGIYG